MEKIKAIREALKLKQKDFADALNITQSYLSAVETGRKSVTTKIIEVLIAKFNVSPEWFYNSNGNIFNSSMGNIVGEISGENTRFSKRGSTSSEDTNQLLFNGDYERNRADFYYRHTDHRLNQLLIVTTNDLKQIFNDYSKLIKLSEDFGAPDFILEKFTIGPKFNDYKKTIDTEFAENNSHVKDEKILKSFKIVTYESDIKHFQEAISQLINYMDRYADFYKGYNKESRFKE